MPPAGEPPDTMHQGPQLRADAGGLRIGVAVSRYHGEVTGAMRRAAEEAFSAAGGSAQNLLVIEAPGAFELTAVCRALADNGLDAVVALGCVIAGETRHDRHLADAVAQGLTAITVRTGVPVAFGVLTCENLEQAKARSGGDKGNKGAEAMQAAIAAARAVQAIRGERRA